MSTRNSEITEQLNRLLVAATWVSVNDSRESCVLYQFVTLQREVMLTHIGILKLDAALKQRLIKKLYIVAY